MGPEVGLNLPMFKTTQTTRGSCGIDQQHTQHMRRWGAAKDDNAGKRVRAIKTVQDFPGGLWWLGVPPKAWLAALALNGVKEARQTGEGILRLIGTGRRKVWKAYCKRTKEREATKGEGVQTAPGLRDRGRARPRIQLQKRKGVDATNRTNLQEWKIRDELCRKLLYPSLGMPMGTPLIFPEQYVPEEGGETMSIDGLSLLQKTERSIITDELWDGTRDAILEGLQGWGGPWQLLRVEEGSSPAQVEICMTEDLPEDTNIMGMWGLRRDETQPVQGPVSWTPRGCRWHANAVWEGPNQGMATTCKAVKAGDPLRVWRTIEAVPCDLCVTDWQESKLMENSSHTIARILQKFPHWKVVWFNPTETPVMKIITTVVSWKTCRGSISRHSQHTMQLLLGRVEDLLQRYPQLAGEIHPGWRTRQISQRRKMINTIDGLVLAAYAWKVNIRIFGSTVRRTMRPTERHSWRRQRRHIQVPGAHLEVLIIHDIHGDKRWGLLELEGLMMSLPRDIETALPERQQKKRRR